LVHKNNLTQPLSAGITPNIIDQASPFCLKRLGSDSFVNWQRLPATVLIITEIRKPTRDPPPPAVKPSHLDALTFTR